MKTKEELKKIAKNEIELGNEWKIKRCSICNEIYSVYVDEEDTFYRIKDHANCYKIKKYESLSIFDKESINNTFENATIENEKEKEYIQRFKKYCDIFQEIKEKGLGILMCGNAGTGKTFYSNCISNELKSKGFAVLSFNLTKYLNELRNFKEGETEKNIIEAIKSVDCVIIDDIGNEKLTDWGIEKMFSLFNEIYLNKKSCILSTNLSKNQLEEHFKILDSKKITDRLSELCRPFIFDWESRRTKIGKEKSKDLF